MNKVQFFYDSDLDKLQISINGWLAEHKEVKVEETNLNSLGKPGSRTDIEERRQYVFYIRYSTDKYEEAQVAMAAKEEMTPVEKLISDINETPATAN